MCANSFTSNRLGGKNRNLIVSPFTSCRASLAVELSGPVILKKRGGVKKGT